MRVALSAIWSASGRRTSPPSAWKSATSGRLTYTGSIAIALSAEYGEVSPEAGCPRAATAGHADRRAASTRRVTPDRRCPRCRRCATSAARTAGQRGRHCGRGGLWAHARGEPFNRSSADGRQQAAGGAAENIGTGEQADDQIAIAGKVEEVARVHEQMLLVRADESRTRPRASCAGCAGRRTSRLRCAAPDTKGGGTQRLSSWR